VVGEHRGAHHFTVGQRRGIGVFAAEPRYVLATDAERNTVTVGPRAALATDEVRVRDLVLHRPAAEVDAVKLRYRSRPVPCRVEGDTLRLAEPVTAAAPGQAAVLLRGDAIVGCGSIVRGR
jgi:tRNA-specific 2-thiouridylase